MMNLVLWWVCFMVAMVTAQDRSNLKEFNSCDIGFVLDTSGSIRKTDYVKEKKFVIDVAKYLGIGKDSQHYGVILFSQYASMNVKFTDYYDFDDFKNAVLALKRVGSITRIDYGLLKAFDLFSPKGGYRKNANKVLFLLTDGTQTKGRDVVDNSLISRNLRHEGIEFYMLGIGRGIKRKELLKIAGGPGRLFIAKNFEELTSLDFIRQFNISCDANRFKNSKKYHLQIRFLNQRTNRYNSDFTFSITEKRKDITEIVNVLGTHERMYQKQKFVQEPPRVSVTAFQNPRSGDAESNQILIDGKEYLELNYDLAPRQHTIILKDHEIVYKNGYEILFTISNQHPIQVRLEGWQDQSIIFTRLVKPNSTYNLGNISTYSDGDIVFKVYWGNSEISAPLNGVSEGYYTLTLQKNLHQLSLFSYPLKKSKELESYSAMLTIFNAGRTNLKFFYQDKEFKVDKGMYVSRSIMSMSQEQPTAILMSVAKSGDQNESRYHVMEIMPTLERTNITLVIGSEFDAYVPLTFQMNIYNYAKKPSILSLKVGRQTVDMNVALGYSKTQIIMKYMSPMLAIGVTAYTKDILGSRGHIIFTNGKPFELLSPHNADVVITTTKVLNRFAKLKFENRADRDVILRWTIDDIRKLAPPMPRNNILIKKNTTQGNVDLVFNFYKTLPSFKLTANGDGNGEIMMVNGKIGLNIDFKTSPRSREHFVIEAPKFKYYAFFEVNNPFDYVVELEWAINDKDYVLPSLKSTSPSKYRIKPKSYTAIKIELITEKDMVEFRSDVIVLTGKSLRDGVAVLFNGKYALPINMTDFKDASAEDVVISEPGLTYYIGFVVKNALLTPVTISWTFNPTTNINYGFSSRKYKNGYGNIEFAPGTSMVESIKVKTMKEDLKELTIPSLINLSARRRDSNEVITSTTLDASKYEVYLREFVFEESKPTNEKQSHDFNRDVLISNPFNRDIEVWWQFMSADSFMTAQSEKRYILKPGDSKTIKIKYSSSIPRTDTELRHLIGVSARDIKTGHFLLVNGKMVSTVPSLESGNVNGAQSKLNVQPPTEYRYFFTLHAYNNLREDVVLKWGFADQKSEMYTPKKQSKRFLISPDATFSKTIEVRSKEMLEANDLQKSVQFTVTRKSDSSPLLLNGERFVNIDVYTYGNHMNTTRFIVSEEAYSYHVGFKFTNPLSENLKLDWSFTRQDQSLYSPSQKNFILIPGETREIKLLMKYPTKMSNDVSNNLIKVSATGESSNQRVTFAGKQWLMLSARGDDDESIPPIEINVEMLKEFIYTFSFTGINQFSSPVILSWKLDDKIQGNLTMLTKNDQINIDSQTHPFSIKFRSKTLIQQNTMKDTLVFSAVSASDGQLLKVNGLKQYKVNLTSGDDQKQPEMLLIGRKGLMYYASIYVPNNYDFPIVIGWKLNYPDSMYGHGEKSFRVDPGSAKQFNLVLQAPSSLDGFTRMVTWCGYNDIAKDKILLNGQYEWMTSVFPFDQDKPFVPTKYVKVSIPDGGQYIFNFIAYNPMSYPITLNWRLTGQLAEVLKTAQSDVVVVGPNSKFSGFIQFKTPEYLDLYQIRTTVQNGSIKFNVFENDTTKKNHRINGLKVFQSSILKSGKQTDPVIMIVTEGAWFEFPISATFENPFNFPIILSWRFNYQENSVIFTSSSPKVVRISPKQRYNLRINVFSPRKVNKDEVKEIILVSAINEQNDLALLINNEPEFKLNGTGEINTPTIKSSEPRYYIQFEMTNNQVIKPAIIRWSLNKNVAQKHNILSSDPQTEFYLAPGQKRNFTISLTSSDPLLTESKLKQLITVMGFTTSFDIRNQQSNDNTYQIFLNDQRKLFLDGTTKKGAFTPIVIKESSATPAKVFLYTTSFTINNPDFPVLILYWDLTMKDPAVWSHSPRIFTIKKNGTFTGRIDVMSKRPLLSEELQQLVRLCAFISSSINIFTSAQPLDINGKKFSHLVFTKQPSSATEGDSLTFKIPSEFIYTLRMNIHNTLPNTITIKWVFNKYSKDLTTDFPSTFEMMPSQRKQVNIKFKSSRMLNDDLYELVNLIAANNYSQKRVLINGRQEINLSLTLPSVSGQQSYLLHQFFQLPSKRPVELFIAEKEYKFHSQFFVNNPLNETVTLYWKFMYRPSDTFLYANDLEDRYTLSPHVDNILALNFGSPGKPVHKDLRKFILSASTEKGNRPLLINGESTFAYIIKNDYEKFYKPPTFKISERRSYNYYAKLDVNNELGFDALVRWSLTKTKIPLDLKPLTPNEIPISGNSKKAMQLKFALKTPLTLEQQRNMVKISAVLSRWNSPVFVNGKHTFHSDVYLDEGSMDKPSKVVHLTGKETHYMARMNISNSLQQPIIVRWISRHGPNTASPARFNDPKTFLIDAESNKLISISLRFENDVPTLTSSNVISGMINVSAYLEGTTQPVLWNGMKVWAIDGVKISEDIQSENVTLEYQNIKSSLPTDFSYYITMNFDSVLSSPIRLRWRFVNPALGLRSDSPKDLNMNIREVQKIRFTSPTILSENDRQGVIEVSAINKDTEESVLLNGKDRLYMTLLPEQPIDPTAYGTVPKDMEMGQQTSTEEMETRPMKVVATSKKWIYSSNFIVKNPLKTPLILRRTTLLRSDGVYSTQPEQYIIPGGDSFLVKNILYSNEKLKNEQMTGVFGFTAEDADTREKVLLDGQTMMLVDVVSFYGKVKSIHTEVTRQSDYNTVAFEIFNTLNLPVVFKVQNIDPSPKTSNNRSKTYDIGSRARKFLRYRWMKTNGDCVSLSSEKSENESQILVNQMPNARYCTNTNLSDILNVVLSKESVSCVTVVVNNKWTKDIEMVDNTDNLKSVAANDDKMIKYQSSRGFIFISKLSDTTHPKNVRIQLREPDSGLLLLFPGDETHLDMLHQPYPQEYVLNIQGAYRIYMDRPSFLQIQMTSLTSSDAVIKVRNISGLEIATRKLGTGKVSILNLPITYSETYPFMHIIEAESTNGLPLFINGEKAFKVIPTSQKVPIPVFIGDERDAKDAPKTFYLDITVKNNWINQVTAVWETNGTREKMDIPSGQSRQRILVATGEAQPDHLLFRIKDENYGSSILIDGENYSPLDYQTFLIPIVIEVNEKGDAQFIRKYFNILKFQNTMSRSSMISWNKKTMQLMPGQTVYKMINSNDGKEIQINTYSPELQQLSMNGRRTLQVKPWSRQTEVESVIISNKFIEKPAVRATTFIFVNKLDHPVNIFWNGKSKVQIESKEIKTISYMLPNVTSVKMNARLQKNLLRRVHMNGRFETLLPNGGDLKEFYVYYINIKFSRRYPQERPYYISAVFKNTEPDEVEVKYRVQNEYSGSVMILATDKQWTYRRIFDDSDATPQSIEFQFYKKQDQTLIPMNGEDILRLKSARYYEDMFFDVDSNSKDLMKLVFANPLPYNITVRAENDSISQKFIIPGNSYKEERVRIPDNTAIKYRVFSVNNRPEYVNGVRGFFTVQRQPNQFPHTRKILIGYKGPQTDVLYHNIIRANFRITNNRDDPVRMKISLSDERKDAKMINPGKTISYESVLYTKDDVDSQNSPFIINYIDQKSSNHLLVKQTELRKVSDKEYSLQEDVTLDKTAKEIIRYCNVQIDIRNYASKLVTVIYNDGYSKPYRLQISPYSKSSENIKYELTQPYGEFSLHSNDLVSLNGKHDKLKYSIANDIYVLLLVDGKENGREIQFDVSNTLKEPVNIRWMTNGQEYSVTMKPQSKTTFSLYLPMSQRVLELSAFMSETGEQLFLGNQRVYYMKISQNPSEETNTVSPPTTSNGLSTANNGNQRDSRIPEDLAVTNEPMEKSRVISIDFTNSQKYPVFVRSVDSSMKFSPVLIEGNSTEKVYINLPNYLPKVKLQAYGVGNPLMINRKYFFSVKPGEGSYVARVHEKGNYFKYAYDIDVTNGSPEESVVNWGEEGQQKTVEIPPNGNRLIRVKSNTQTSPSLRLFGSIKKTGKQLYLNGQSSFKVHPDVEDAHLFVRMTQDQFSSPAKYYLMILVQNKMNEHMRLNWLWNNRPVFMNIPANNQKYIKHYIILSKSPLAPQPITLTAEMKNDMSSVLLNGQSSVQIMPSRQKSCVIVYGTDSKDQKNKIQPMIARISNPLPVQVTMHWESNGNERSLLIQPKSKINIRDVFTTAPNGYIRPIIFNAYDDVSKIQLLLNRNKILDVKPTSETIKITVSKAIDTTYYGLRVTNINNRVIHLTWSYLKDGKQVTDPQTIKIPAKAQRYSVNKVFKFVPSELKLIAKDSGDNTEYYINNRVSFTPTVLSPQYVGDMITINGKKMKKIFFINMKITNLIKEPASINWIVNNVKYSSVIPPYYFGKIITRTVEDFEAPEPIKITSTVNTTNTKLYTNDEPFIYLQPVGEQDVDVVNVYVSRESTVRKNNLYFNNPTSSGVYVTLRSRSYNGRVLIPSHVTRFKATVTTNGDLTPTIFIHASTENNAEPVLVNSNSNYSVRIPHEKEIFLDFPYKTIDIQNTLFTPVQVSGTPGGISITIPIVSRKTINIILYSIPNTGITFTAVTSPANKEVPINGEKQYIVQNNNRITGLKVGAVNSQNKRYYAKFWVTNDYLEPVTIYWRDNRLEKMYLVPKSFNGPVVLDFSSDRNSVSISARGPSDDETTIFLNRRSSIRVTNFNDPQAVSVVLSSDISRHDYFYRFIIINENDKPVSLYMKNSNGDDVRTIQIPAMEFKYVINLPFSNITEGVDKPYKVYAYNSDGNQLYIDGDQEYSTVFPTLNYIEATVVNVGYEIIPMTLYYYSLLVQTPLGINVILKYTLPNGTEKTARIPSNLTENQRPYSLLIKYRSLKPDTMKVTALNEDSDAPMLINLANQYMATPSDDISYKYIIDVTVVKNDKIDPSNSGNFIVYLAKVFNPNTQTVQLQWKHNGIVRHQKLPPMRSVPFIYRITSSGNQSKFPLILRAYYGGDVIKINKVNSYGLAPISSQTNGKSPVLRVSRLEGVHIMINNTLNVNVQLQWVVTDANGRKIATKQIVGAKKKKYGRMIKATLSDKVLFTARSKQRAVAVNAKKTFIIKPLRASFKKGMVYTIVITALKYYYNLQVENMELYPARLLWDINGKQHARIINGEQKAKITVTDEDVNSLLFPLLFSAYRYVRNKPLYLNNKYSAVVEPSTDQFKIRKAYISSKATVNGLLFLNLRIINKAGSNVLLRWSVGQQKERKLIRKGANFMLKLSFPKSKSSLIQFTGNVMTNNDRLKLNRAEHLYLVPTNDGKVTVVEINRLDQKPSVYFLNLLVQNYKNSPIIIDYKRTGKGSSNILSIPANYHREFNLVFPMFDSQPISVEFVARNANTKRLLLLNQQTVYRFQPNSKEEARIFNIGDIVPVRKGLSGKLPENFQGYPQMFGLYLINNGNQQVTVQWKDPQTKKTRFLIVPAKSFQRHMSFIRDKGREYVWIPLKAQQVTVDGTKRTPLLNGRSYTYARTSYDRAWNFFYIAYDNSSERSDYKYYHYTIKVNNMASYDVIMKWTEPTGYRQQYRVKALSTDVLYGIVRSATYPQPFSVYGFNYKTNGRIMFNGVTNVQVQARRTNQIAYIYIPTDINDMRMNTYYLGFDIINMLREPVKVHWTQTDQNIDYSVSAYSQRQYTTSMVSLSKPKKIRVTATSIKTGKPVRINGQGSMYASLSLVWGQYVLRIGESDPHLTSEDPVNYYAEIQVENKAQKPLVLKWASGKTMKKYEIPVLPKVTTYKVTLPSKMRPENLVFTVYEDNTNKQGKVNGLDSLILQPRRNRILSHLTLTLSEFGQLRTDEEICTERMDVAILIDSSGSMKTAYPIAKEFVKLMSEYLLLSSNSSQIGVISFSEKARLNIPFHKHGTHDSFFKDIDNIPFIGYRTRIDLAFDIANELFFNSQYGARDDSKKILILLTDGRQNSGDVSKRAVKKAQESSLPLIKKGVSITAIGLYGSYDPDLKMLEKLTRDKENAYLIDNFSDILSPPFIKGLLKKHGKC